MHGGPINSFVAGWLPAFLPGYLSIHASELAEREAEGRKARRHFHYWMERRWERKRREGSAAIIIIPANELNIIIREKKNTFRARASNGPVLPVIVLEQKISSEA